MQILAALLLDAIFGDPMALPHPVAGIGRLIAFYGKILYARDNAKTRARTVMPRCLTLLS